MLVCYIIFINRAVRVPTDQGPFFVADGYPMVRVTLAHGARPLVVVARLAKQPAWKVRVDIVDITQRKKVASIVGYGDTLDVIDKMRKECAWAVRNGGRYGCTDTEVSFLRYGAPRNASTSLTFFAEPAEMGDQTVYFPESSGESDTDINPRFLSEDDMWSEDT